MMKSYLILIFFICYTNCFSQKDSLHIGDTYWEDQLYLSVTYNILNNQPTGVGSSDVSYGLSLGYIKDIPFNKEGKIALGLGFGYNYDVFRHSLVFNETSTFSVNDNVSSNRIRLHNIEFPLQLRWRTSDIETYSFWRIYAGVRLTYNFSNRFSYILDDIESVYKNIDYYNKFQTGLELSAGYGAFNFYIYYGLTPIYENATYDAKTLNTGIAKFGLIFYLL